MKSSGIYYKGRQFSTVWILAAIILISLISYARAQDAPPSGLEYLQQRIGAADMSIARLLDENKMLRAEVAKLQEAAKPKDVPPVKLPDGKK